MTLDFRCRLENLKLSEVWIVWSSSKEKWYWQYGKCVSKKHPQTCSWSWVLDVWLSRWCGGVLDVGEEAIILLVSVAWGFLATRHLARWHRQNTPTSAPQSIYILHPQPTSLWENSQDSAKSLFIAISTPSEKRKVVLTKWLKRIFLQCLTLWFRLILYVGHYGFNIQACLPEAKPIPVHPPLSGILKSRIWKLLNHI